MSNSKSGAVELTTDIIIQPDQSVVLAHTEVDISNPNKKIKAYAYASGAIETLDENKISYLSIALSISGPSYPTPIVFSGAATFTSTSFKTQLGNLIRTMQAASLISIVPGADGGGKTLIPGKYKLDLIARVIGDAPIGIRALSEDETHGAGLGFDEIDSVWW